LRGGELGERHGGIAHPFGFDALGNPARAADELAGWAVGALEELLLDARALPTLRSEDPPVLWPQNQQRVECEALAAMRYPLERRRETRCQFLRLACQLIDDQAGRFGSKERHPGLRRSQPGAIVGEA